MRIELIKVRSVRVLRCTDWHLYTSCIIRALHCRMGRCCRRMSAAFASIDQRLLVSLNEGSTCVASRRVVCMR